MVWGSRVLYLKRGVVGTPAAPGNGSSCIFSVPGHHPSYPRDPTTPAKSTAAPQTCLDAEATGTSTHSLSVLRCMRPVAGHSWQSCPQDPRSRRTCLCRLAVAPSTVCLHPLGGHCHSALQGVGSHVYWDRVPHTDKKT